MLIRTSRSFLAILALVVLTLIVVALLVAYHIHPGMFWPVSLRPNAFWPTK